MARKFGKRGKTGQSEPQDPAALFGAPQPPRQSAHPASSTPLADLLNQGMPGVDGGYVVLPRSLAEGMSLPWQQQMAALLAQFHAEHARLSWPVYRVVPSRYERLVDLDEEQLAEAGYLVEMDAEGEMVYRERSGRKVQDPDRTTVLVSCLDPIPRPAAAGPVPSGEAPPVGPLAAAVPMNIGPAPVWRSSAPEGAVGKQPKPVQAAAAPGTSEVNGPAQAPSPPEAPVSPAEQASEAAGPETASVPAEETPQPSPVVEAPAETAAPPAAIPADSAAQPSMPPAAPTPVDPQLQARQAWQPKPYVHEPRQPARPAEPLPQQGNPAVPPHGRHEAAPPSGWHGQNPAVQQSQAPQPGAQQYGAGSPPAQPAPATPPAACGSNPARATTGHSAGAHRGTRTSARVRCGATGSARTSGTAGSVGDWRGADEPACTWCAATGSAHESSGAADGSRRTQRGVGESACACRITTAPSCAAPVTASRS